MGEDETQPTELCDNSKKCKQFPGNFEEAWGVASA